MAAERLVIAGEIYSANLGDGVIHETLKHLFLSQCPTLQITALDISGRSGWRHTPFPSSLKKKTMGFGKVHLGAVYSFANALRLLALIRSRHSHGWKKILGNSSTLIIGGGQLLMDNHLDFPVKLHELVQLSQKLQIPFHLTACGVKAGWSPVARVLLRSVLRGASSITLRDRASKSNLVRLAPQVSPAVTFDPAIYAADVYARSTGGSQNLIGLGVISPLDVNLHRPRTSLVSETGWIDAWLGIIRALQARGLRSQIFTNGSPADEEFAGKLQARAQVISPGLLPMATRAVFPKELAHRISGYSGIIAARLHANLIAASYGIPAVGLSWEEKVTSFFDEIGQAENQFPLDGLDPEDVVERLSTSIRQGVNHLTIEKCQGKALSNVTVVMENTD